MRIPRSIDRKVEDSAPRHSENNTPKKAEPEFAEGASKFKGRIPGPISPEASARAAKIVDEREKLPYPMPWPED